MESKNSDVQTQAKIDMPQIDFVTFIISLSSSALVQMGEIPSPNNEKVEKNLVLVKQTIDIIAMLQEKTIGNLTAQEDKFVQDILFELRMKYVQQDKS